ncbi:MAG: hypothetical protein ACFNZT_03360 [Streptococcus mutans]
MKILNIELTSIDKTDLGFEHWVAVTYRLPFLKHEYTANLLLLLDFEIEDKELLDYLVTSWKYRDIVEHSTMMYQIERGKKGAKMP